MSDLEKCRSILKHLKHEADRANDSARRERTEDTLSKARNASDKYRRAVKLFIDAAATVISEATVQALAKIAENDNLTHN